VSVYVYTDGHPFTDRSSKICRQTNQICLLTNNPMLKVHINLYHHVINHKACKINLFEILHMNRNLICHKSNMNTWSYCTNTELDAHSSFSEIPTIFVLSAICLASHSSRRQSQKHLQKRCLHSHMFGFTQHTSHIGYNSQFTSTKCTILGEVKNRRHP
jgi:hypothetical protein